jgi:hypothetical protein
MKHINNALVMPFESRIKAVRIPFGIIATQKKERDDL